MESSPTVAIDRGFFHCFHFNFGGKNRIKIMFQEDYEFFMPDCCAKNHWIAKQKTQKKKKRKQITMSPTLSSRLLGFYVEAIFRLSVFFCFRSRQLKTSEPRQRPKKRSRKAGTFWGWNLLRCIFFGDTGFLCLFCCFFLTILLFPFYRHFF